MLLQLLSIWTLRPTLFFSRVLQQPILCHTVRNTHNLLSSSFPLMSFVYLHLMNNNLLQVLAGQLVPTLCQLPVC